MVGTALVVANYSAVASSHADLHCAYDDDATTMSAMSGGDGCNTIVVSVDVS